MTLEEFSPWAAGAGRVAFTIVPGDFESNGPHRLVLQARVRTLGLTDSWEIEPPHMPFLFEFDPNLRLDAILTLPDANRDEIVRAGYPARACDRGSGWEFELRLTRCGVGTSRPSQARGDTATSVRPGP